MVNRLHYVIAHDRAADIARASRRAARAEEHVASRSNGLRRRALVALRELSRTKEAAASPGHGRAPAPLEETPGV